MFYPIQLLADWLVYSVLSIQRQSLLGDAVNFFIFDSVKIFILLAVIIFAVSFVRSFLPPEKIRSILVRKNLYSGNILASLLGVLTPFCSCSDPLMDPSHVEVLIPSVLELESELGSVSLGESA